MKIRLFLIAIISVLLFTGCRAHDEATYNWESDISDYLSSQYPDLEYELSTGGMRDSTHVHHCKTLDDYGFEFDVECTYYDSVDFFVYERKKHINDTLRTVVGEYISDQYGKYSITDKDIGDVTKYVTETMVTAQDIMRDYGYPWAAIDSIKVRFIFYSADDVYLFETWSAHEDTIRQELTELLEEGNNIGKD